MKNPVVVLTIGHFTRKLDIFLNLSQAHGAKRLVDVRTIPRSRNNPQFNKDTLPTALQSVGLTYTHMAGLGGWRHTRLDSPNGAWRNPSFRGYADYMQTPEFTENLQVLIDVARKEPIALICAEAVPWRCHRSLIAFRHTIVFQRKTQSRPEVTTEKLWRSFCTARHFVLHTILPPFGCHRNRS